jgi:myo-inositol-1(or 4)-monophosphatase
MSGDALPPRAALEAIAVRGGELALRHFQHVAAERKADRTLVTRADREVEAFLVDELAGLMPTAAILGEEGTARAGTSAYRIVLDPIDGTAAFVAGLPTWCICIGILAGSEAVAGVVHVPCARETYAAVDGVGWWNGTRLPALGNEWEKGDRFIVSHAKAHLRYKLGYPGKVRALGSTAYHVALVARGVAEAAIAGRAHLWDLVAPGAVLAAVGGRFVYASGEAVDLGVLADGRRAPADVIAGAPDRLQELLPLLGPPG